MYRERYRRILLAVLSLLLAWVVAACAPAAVPSAGDEGAAMEAGQAEEAPQMSEAEAVRRKTVIFDIDGGRVADPELWNPHVPGSRRDHGFHQAILEPLFILSYETGEIEPWLGESMTPNETQDVWTLKLREGVTWSDGEAFDADDVMFTIQMFLDNAPELTYSGDLSSWIESIEKIDDQTVQFTLTGPNPRFLLDNFSVKIFGGPSILPEHIWADQDPLTFTYYDPEKGWPVGTGPYKLDTVDPTEFVYVRDDNWWGAQAGWKPLPEPETLIWTWAGPEETRAALMADGQLDSLMDVTLGVLQVLQAGNPNLVAWRDALPFTWAGPCSRTFEFNHTMAPWDDKEMRWALNHAIDRDQIVAVAYEGTTTASEHFFPAYPPLNRYVQLAKDAGLYEKYPLTEYNPEKAKELIESKGYTLNSNGYYEKDGEELAIDITTHEAFIEKQRIAQVLVEQLQAVGINAVNRNEAGGTWNENFSLGNFEARMGWQTCGSVNEPWGAMETMNTKWLKPVGERAEKNQWRWSGEAADEYSAIVDEIGTLPLGDPKIDELFVQAMEFWMDELPVIPISQAKKLIPFDGTYWTGWPRAEHDNYLQPTTWWQSTHMIIHNLEATQP